MTIDQSEVDAVENLGREFVQRGEAEITRLRRDLEIIAEALRDEAMNRDWCSEYGDWIERVNMRTSEAHLLNCSVTQEVVYQVTVAVTGRSGNYVNEAMTAVKSQLDHAVDDLDLDGVDDITSSVNVINL